jgi:RNA polymerase sigma-70 factor (ECF subfamily)
LVQLSRVAGAIVGDPAAAQDVVHEAFVRAVRQRQSYDGRGDVNGWVWRIVVNTALDVRARRREEESLDAFSEPEVLAEEAERELVRAAVEQLPERQRLVLFLRYYADLDYRAIAEAAGVSEGTIAATLHTARERLRELLSEVCR